MALNVFIILNLYLLGSGHRQVLCNICMTTFSPCYCVLVFNAESCYSNVVRLHLSALPERVLVFYESHSNLLSSLPRPI